MYSAKPDNNKGITNRSNQADTSATDSEKDDAELPLLVVDRSENGENTGKFNAGLNIRSGWISRGLFLIPIVLISIAVGGILGLYRQPLPLQKVMGFLGLEPGGGTTSPIAVSVKEKVVIDVSTTAGQGLETSSIMALGRLLPAGEVITVALPSGVRDARISSLNVTEGSRVKQGDILAILDSEPRLQAVRDSAKATIAVREAALEQTRVSIRASFVESKAGVERAKASAHRAKLDFQRSQNLYSKKIIAKASYDQTRATYLEAIKEVERLQATLSRFISKDLEDQPDIVIAQRNLEAARAEYRRTEQEFEQAYVRAPVDGTVLEIHSSAGEKPDVKGVLDLGNVDQMTAKLEVYETLVRHIALGNQVSITTKALPEKLSGKVVRIGLQIKKQSVISANPAANTDARVVEVIVQLDKASSAISSHFTNLQVEARIIPGTSQ